MCSPRWLARDNEYRHIVALDQLTVSHESVEDGGLLQPARDRAPRPSISASGI